MVRGLVQDLLALAAASPAPHPTLPPAEDLLLCSAGGLAARVLPLLYTVVAAWPEALAAPPLPKDPAADLVHGELLAQCRPHAEERLWDPLGLALATGVQQLCLSYLAPPTPCTPFDMQASPMRAIALTPMRAAVSIPCTSQSSLASAPSLRRGGGQQLSLALATGLLLTLQKVAGAPGAGVRQGLEGGEVPWAKFRDPQLWAMASRSLLRPSTPSPVGAAEHTGVQQGLEGVQCSLWGPVVQHAVEVLCACSALAAERQQGGAAGEGCAALLLQCQAALQLAARTLDRPGPVLGYVLSPLAEQLPRGRVGQGGAGDQLPHRHGAGHLLQALAAVAGDQLDRAQALSAAFRELPGTVSTSGYLDLCDTLAQQLSQPMQPMQLDGAPVVHEQGAQGHEVHAAAALTCLVGLFMLPAGGAAQGAGQGGVQGGSAAGGMASGAQAQVELKLQPVLRSLRTWVTQQQPETLMGLPTQTRHMLREFAGTAQARPN